MVLGPGYVVQEGVVLRHLLEKLFALPHEGLADLLEEDRGQHPWDTDPALLSSHPEHADHLAVHENDPVVLAGLEGSSKGIPRRDPGEVPDLVLVLLTHGHGEFEDVLVVRLTNKNVRWPDYA